MTTATFPPTWPITRYIELLRRHRQELAARYHLATLGLFGSYVRNQQHSGSDLDLLVTFAHPPSLFQLVALQDELTTLLGVRVDLTLRSALRPRIGQRILREVVEL